MADASDIWMGAAEIAALGLPDLPRTKRGVQELADREGWRASGMARRRAGAGGGFEYHANLLPARAQAALLAQQARAAAEEAAEAAAAGAEDDAAWARYWAASEAQRARAAERLNAVRDVARLVDGGMPARLAVEAVARLTGAAPASIWAWRDRVAGVRADRQAAHLLDKRACAVREARTAEMPDAVWEMFLADWLRLSRPSLESCVDRTARWAAEHGMTCPGAQAFRRRVKRELRVETITLAREGVEALKQLRPAQRRDKTTLHAMEAVNADGHKWDVVVEWPDGQRGRPCMVAFQDIHSGRVLSWRIDRSENRQSVLLAFGDMVEAFGIPDHMVLDNGRGFASKWLTGRAKTRFRFTIKDDDPIGVFPLFGITIHWAMPYSGRSKPIERAFRDFADRIAKHPAFEGAYVGNSPVNKPENHGTRAVPFAEFQRVVAREIVAHNTRIGRRSEVCAGRSFVEAFEASYADAPVRRASADQRRLWLMGAEGVMAQRPSGAVELFGNLFWGEASPALAGRKVIARFDPANLHDGIWLETLSGREIGHVGCLEKTGFFAVAQAREDQRLRRAQLKAERAALEAMRLRTAAEIARELEALSAPDDPAPAPGRVVRPVFGGAGAAARLSFAEALDEEERIDVAAMAAAQERGLRLIHGGEVG